MIGKTILRRRITYPHYTDLMLRVARKIVVYFSITTEIGKKNLFNSGTAFKGLLSRMRNTVDNILVDDNKFLRKDGTNPDRFRFLRNYIQIMN